MNGQQRDDMSELLAGLSRREVTPEPEHDADYFRGLLKVIAEHGRRIPIDIKTLEQSRAQLESQQRQVEQQRRDAVLRSRNLLTRGEVARILKLSPATVSALIAAELKRRNMGATL